MLSKIFEAKEQRTFLESPVVAPDGAVFFSDIANNRILRFNPEASECNVFRSPSGRANGLFFDKNGFLVVCEGNEFGENDGGRRVTRINSVNDEAEILTERFEGRRYNAPNDLVIRSNGQIFFTDPCYGDRSYVELDHESVYRIDGDGKVTRLITQPEIQRPNGIALSPDEKILYVVDSCTVLGGNRKIWAFDLSLRGAISNQRVFFDFAPGRGGDGMDVDVAGNLYIAAGINRARGPQETGDAPAGVYIFNPDGKLMHRIPIPEDLVTNVALDRRDFKTLYITAGRTLYSIVIQETGRY